MKATSLVLNSKRKVFCHDSLKWLKGKRIQVIITSLPDSHEVHLSVGEYYTWLKEAVTIIIRCLEEDGCIIFYQTNRKFKGRLVDKEFIISSLFYEKGYKKVFQKIVLRKTPEKIDLYRPSFSSMFCFSRKITAGLGDPDVIYAGKLLSPNGMGINACDAAIDFIQKRYSNPIIVDPFCGIGTVLAVANQKGLRAIGVDIIEENARASRKLQLS